jgi:hypothetical protein
MGEASAPFIGPWVTGGEQSGRGVDGRWWIPFKTHKCWRGDDETVVGLGGQEYGARRWLDSGSLRAEGKPARARWPGNREAAAVNWRRWRKETTGGVG